MAGSFIWVYLFSSSPILPTFWGVISIWWVLLEWNRLWEIHMALSKERYKCLQTTGQQSWISSSHDPAPWEERTVLSNGKSPFSLEPSWLWGSLRLLLIWKDHGITSVMRRQYVLNFHLPKILFHPVGKSSTDSEHLSIFLKDI